MESAVVAAIIVGSLSLLSLAYQKYWEKRREIEQELRRKKAEIYEKFMRTWLMLIPLAGSDQKDISLEKLENSFKEIAIGLTIWGSDDVVEKWSAIRRDLSLQTEKESENLLQSLLAIEELLLCMRLDLGHKNADLKPKDVLRIFVTDIDQVSE